MTESELKAMNLEELKSLKSKVESALAKADREKFDKLPAPLIERVEVLSRKLREEYIVEVLVPCTIKVVADGPDYVSTFAVDYYFSQGDCEAGLIPMTASSRQEIESKKTILETRQEEFDGLRDHIINEYEVDIWEVLKSKGYED